MTIFKGNNLSEEEKAKNHTIMVVDDEDGILKSLESLLSPIYKVITAGKAKEAMGIISMMQHPEKISLIICDQRMPEMSGLEFLKEIKDKIPNTIRIILTAFDDKTVMIKAINEVNIYQFILKPFEPEDLLLRVKRAIETFDYKQELAKYRISLEKQVKERTHELEERNKQLNKVNAEKGKIYSIVGHDLKNMMQIHTGVAGLLFKEYESLSQKKIKGYISDIYKNQHNISDLLVNLLAWANFQSGELKWKPEKVSIKEAVGKNIQLFKQNAEQKQIDLSSKIDTKAVVLADTQMTLFIIRNLISNALKFTRKGGWVRVSAKVGKDWVEITVEDNGIGMTKEEIEGLFRMSKQIIKKGTSGERGTGLGLLVCKQFVEKNMGKIEVTGKPGIGSCFKFKLPAYAT